MQDYQTFFNGLTQGATLLETINTLKYCYHPRELVYQHDKVQLFHYPPPKKMAEAPTLFIVFATINRPEILDLTPHDSFIGQLSQEGLNIYLLDWGYPDAKDNHLSMDDYVITYLQSCVNWIRKKEGLDTINLMGICQGGILSLCYTALFAHIQQLILIATPVDFKTRHNMVTSLIKRLDRLTLFSGGNIPGSWLKQFFLSLRPFELLGLKYLHFLNHLDDAKMTEDFLRVEKWLHDVPDQPLFAFRQLIEKLYLQNALIEENLTLGGQTVNLQNITIPILNIMGRKDHIVPVSASRALKKMVGSKHYSEKIFNAGHIGLYLSESTRKKLPATIATWLKRQY